MTAVARLTILNKCPILLGDLLITGPKKPGIKAMIPTIENVNSLFTSELGRIPYGMQQKVVIVSDNLMLGWSGDYLTAKEVICDIYTESEESRFTKTSLHKYFMLLPQRIWDQGVGFIGFIKDRNGIAYFGYRYKSIKTKIFGNVGLLGTGSADLEKLLNRYTGIPKPMSGKPNILEVSISLTLSLSGILLNTELATLRSLQNFYGGGYEIATIVNGKFRKLDEIVYIFWIARISEKGVHISQIPRHAMSFVYVDDILIIRSVSFNETKDRVSMSQSGYSVPPMYRIISEQEIDTLHMPDLNQKWLCNYFLVTLPSGDKEIYSRIDYRPKDQRYVKFHEEQNSTIVAVEREFIESVGEEIFHHFR